MRAMIARAARAAQAAQIYLKQPGTPWKGQACVLWERIESWRPDKVFIGACMAVIACLCACQLQSCSSACPFADVCTDLWFACATNKL